eukprot:PITA_13849
MPGIDPSIIVHEIKTYPNAKPVWQRLRQIHPRKVVAIKTEVEKLLKADQPKMAFICPWGTFAYCKLPFGLKNTRETFQRAMSYAFHDIKHIVQPYLDDLPAHSLRRASHLTHLRAIFMRCRHYRIRLNPHKCVFYIETGRLLGLVVSKVGIRVDPSKVEAIVKLPPPSTLRLL